MRLLRVDPAARVTAADVAAALAPGRLALVSDAPTSVALPGLELERHRVFARVLDVLRWDGARAKRLRGGWRLAPGDVLLVRLAMPRGEVELRASRPGRLGIVGVLVEDAK